MQSEISKNEIIDHIRKLDVSERIDIISDIWDEIRDSDDLNYISKKDTIILEERLERYKSNPESATDWNQLKNRVYRKYADKN